MRIIITLFSTIFVLGLQAQVDIVKVSRLLEGHKYGKLYRCFDDNMKENVPKEKLKELWESLEEQGGEFVALENIERKNLEGGSRQIGLIRFEELSMGLELSENEHQQITGLFIRALGYETPDYADGLGVGKRYINFVSNGFELSGELVIPLACKDCPVVILVHGSGPNDRDETIGPNKVFYDVAMGLAKNGIASFRYDKRSNLYPETMKGQFDLYDETINDAISAFNSVYNDTSLYFEKHYILGHSLGAYAMPLIADSLGSTLSGGVLFSANARRLEDLIIYQMKYLTSYDDEISSDEDDIIRENTLNAEKIRTGNFSLETPSSELLAYWPGTFWRGVSTYDPVQVLSENRKTPFLILQGEKDYQITMVDFEIWKKNVGEHKNVILKSYPNLTHLFTPSTSSKPGPNDYFVPQNVSIQVINDIAEWMKK